MLAGVPIEADAECLTLFSASRVCADYRMIQQAMIDMSQMFELLGQQPALQVRGLLLVVWPRQLGGLNTSWLLSQGEVAAPCNGWIAFLTLNLCLCWPAGQAWGNRAGAA